MCFAACILFQVSILLPCPRSEITPLFIRIPLSSVWHTIAAYSSSSTTVEASSICWLFLPVSNRERGNTEREEGWWMGGSFRVTSNYSVQETGARVMRTKKRGEIEKSGIKTEKRSFSGSGRKETAKYRGCRSKDRGRCRKLKGRLRRSRFGCIWDLCRL